MEPAGFAKAHGAAQHGGPGQMHFARLAHDGLIERLVMPAVAFAEKDAQQNRVAGNLHITWALRGSGIQRPRGRATPPPDTESNSPPHSAPRRATPRPAPSSTFAG